MGKQPVREKCKYGLRVGSAGHDRDAEIRNCLDESSVLFDMPIELRKTDRLHVGLFRCEMGSRILEHLGKDVVKTFRVNRARSAAALGEVIAKGEQHSVLIVNDPHSDAKRIIPVYVLHYAPTVQAQITRNNDECVREVG